MRRSKPKMKPTISDPRFLYFFLPIIVCGLGMFFRANSIRDTHKYSRHWRSVISVGIDLMVSAIVAYGLFLLSNAAVSTSDNWLVVAGLTIFLMVITRTVGRYGWSPSVGCPELNVIGWSVPLAAGVIALQIVTAQLQSSMINLAP